MKAGTELDLLIHERVMGLSTVGEYQAGPIKVTRSPAGIWPKAYSVDIEAAWEVFEKMRERYSQVTLQAASGKENYPEPFICEVSQLQDIPRDTHTTFVGHASTAPLAICLAALATLEKA